MDKTRMFFSHLRHFFFVILITNSSLNAMTYTIADLEVLQEGKNYKEFFKHAKDIIPTSRDRHWFEILSTMGTALIDEYRTNDQYTVENFSYIESLAKWPELKRDEFYQIKRNSFAVEYFRDCLTKKDKNTCKPQMMKFWNSSNKDTETAFQLLGLHYGFFPQGNSWVFLREVIKGEQSRFYCDKPLIKNLSFRYLANLDNFLKDESQTNTKLKTLVSKDCWKKLNPYFLTELSNLPASEAKAAFLLLSSNNLLSEAQLDLWHVRYFLDRPEPGDLFNKSWNRLKIIGQNYDRRKAVLKSLKAEDPLPGRSFSTEDKRKAITLTKHLDSHFPEYLSFYTKTCLNYLEGKEVFPRGNPTLDCHQLFTLRSENKEQRLDTITQEISIRYSSLQKMMGK